MLKDRLKELRNKKGMSQRELANFLQLSPSAIAMYETGQREPDSETLKKIADFFNVSIDYLLGRTDLPNAHIPDDYTQKYKVTKRDLKQYEDFIRRAGAFFMDDQVAEEDKEKLFRDISEIFWKAKELNKRKRKKA